MTAGMTFMVDTPAARAKPSSLQDLLVRASGREVLSFALGLPDPDTFPLQQLAHASSWVLDNRDCLQYSPQSESIKQHVVRLMALRGVLCSTSQVFVTSGAQQGLNLLSRLLATTGSLVVIDQASYPGFLQILSTLGVGAVSVRSQTNGSMDLCELERLFATGVRPAFVYAMPEGHNPTGRSMSIGERKRLIALARTWDIPIVEDDAYGFLQYDGDERPPLIKFAPDHVFYVGSFSKILAPSLRTGWIVLPEYLVPAISILKESTDLNITTFSHKIVGRYLDEYDLGEHLKHLKKVYRTKRDVMLNELNIAGLSHLIHVTPRSGFFLWMESGERDSTKLLENAMQRERLAFVPGAAFSFNGEPSNRLRLSFSYPSVDAIKDGIQRLNRLLRTLG